MGTQPRLVLLFAACSVNKFCLSPYNQNVSYTPAIARLASEGMVFTKHQTESGQSGTSYASIFSGMGIKVELVNGRERLLEFLDDEISASITIYKYRNKLLLAQLND